MANAAAVRAEGNTARAERTQPVLKPGPVDTLKRGRPKTIMDMKAYKAQKERERRARMKAK